MLKQLSLALGALALLAGTTHAATIGIASGAGGSGTFLNATRTTAAVDIDAVADPFWDPTPLWVSYAFHTGDAAVAGFFVAPNPSDTRFFAALLSKPAGATWTAFSLTVWADDTTSFEVNGSTIWPQATPASFPVCSPDPIGCLASTKKTFTWADISAAVGASDTIDMQFLVGQRGFDAFGLGYSGDATYEEAPPPPPPPPPVPEPGTLLLLANGLLGVVALRRRARR